MANNTLHDLGMTIINFWIIIDNKRTSSHLQCNAKDTTLLWLAKSCGIKSAQDAFPLIFNAFWDP
jgi:hypothetical protein